MVWAPEPGPLRLVGTPPEPAPAHPGTDAPDTVDPRDPAEQALVGVHRYLDGSARLSERQLLRQLGSGLRGLTEQDADARLAGLGENLLPEARVSLRARLRASARDPFTLVLAALAGASAVIGSIGAAIVITALATVAGTLRFLAERQADRVAALVRDALADTTATVLRRADPDAPPVAREVAPDQLVPGDLVTLGPGDPVPADLRLLRADGLLVSQAALTGESAPVPKAPDLQPKASEVQPQAPVDVASSGTDLFGSPRLCFLGSTVTAGTATGVVLATGPDSHLGATHARPRRRATRTAYGRGSAGIARSLALFSALAATAALTVNAVWFGGGLQAAAFAVAVAVGLTPEMLPLVVSSILARGSVLLGRRRIVVRRMPAVYDLGAMDLLCTDKTGTLTRGRPTLSCRIGPEGTPDPTVLHWAAVNSLLSLEQGDLLTGDPVDEAVLDAAHPLGLPLDADAMSAVAVVPFTPARRRSTVVLRRPGHPGTVTLVTKGAPEEVLPRCSRFRARSADVADRADGPDAADDLPLDAAAQARLLALVDRHAREGTTLLAVARAHRPARLGGYGPGDEARLTLLGFVGLRDELLPGAPAALAALADAGVEVKVVTGDHPAVAARLCREAGIAGADPDTVVTGADIGRLDDMQLAELAARSTVFARTTPHQKARVVAALRRNGRTVGFLGDGVNDLPALAAADVGISADSAVPAARSASDAVLVSKDLTVLGEALTVGRRSVGAIATYLRITFSSNFGNTLSMILGSMLLPFLPMLPTQILVQNLCFDAAQLTLAFDRPQPSAQCAPRILDRRRTMAFMVCFGVLNSLSDLITFALLGHLTGHQHDPAAQAVFRSGWLTENLVTQALALHLLRPDADTGPWSGPWRQRVAAWPVWLAAAALIAAALGLPRSPLAPALGLGALPLSWLPYLALIVGCYCTMVLTARRLWRSRSRQR
ncbi:magnesium-translocating P-type ATPase [Streptacidiphilus sp. EB129]|uniref:magnesium-translocating P-type ATPase n=1 Tax=Streptacidiphilus sp. EB129 TaxID=3156262 RepID=UPI003514D69F